MYLTDAQFIDIYSTVPRVCVDVILTTSDGRVVLQKRDILPDAGRWAVTGGTYYRDESLFSAAQRIAQQDLNLKVIPQKILGPIEFRNEAASMIKHRHSVAIAIHCTADDDAALQQLLQTNPNLQAFEHLPNHMSMEHQQALHNYLNLWIEGEPVIKQIDESSITRQSRMPLERFKQIYSQVPRLVVELFITRQSEQGTETLLTLRNIEPIKGYWHVPGGTVMKGMTLEEAVQHVANHELGTSVTDIKYAGVLEYPWYSTQPSVCDLPIGIAYQCSIIDSHIRLNYQGSHFQWFATPPDPVIPEHRDFIKSQGW